MIVVTTLTLLVAVLGVLTLVRGTRTVTGSATGPPAAQPPWDASAISGEFISMAAFLGTAGLVLAYGIDMLWLPIGAAAGHVVLQAFVTAPLRRSGTFTLAEFALWRLGSRVVQRAVGVCVCFIGWFFLLPQLQSAGVTLRVAAGSPVWVGWTVVAVVALIVVLTGGPRGVTIGRAFRLWLGVVVIAVPVSALIAVWRDDPAMPLHRGGGHSLPATYSLLLCVLLGTMGLPQVVGRPFTPACGRSARRTVALVPALLGLFCISPALYGALGRLYTPGPLMTGQGDAAVAVLPHRLAPGLSGSLLTGLIAAAAFAAFAAASCCVVVAIAGSIARCALGGGAASFRVGGLIAIAVPLGLVAWIGPMGSAGLVTLPCAVSACSLCPLMVLGVWWRRLTPVGAAAGLVVGGALAVMAALAHLFGGPRSGWTGALLAQSTLVIVPLTFAVMVATSLLTPLRVPAGVDRAMARLHLPEELARGRC